jgi:hypothetical protein
MGSIDEDQALRILLDQNSTQEDPQELTKGDCDHGEPSMESGADLPRNPAMISGHSGWSSSESPEQSPNFKRRDTTQSYDAMLESLSLLSGACIRTPEVDDFLKRFSKEEEAQVEKDDFEAIPSAPVSRSSAIETVSHFF